MTDLPGRLHTIRAAFPPEGLFAEKDFLLSPEPFLIDARLHEQLEKLGHRLLVFQRACNDLYHRSAAGKAPAWIADYLDRGKPAELIERGRSKAARNEVPLVIRPDLILTEEGFTIAEIDSVPGGIGLTAWLNGTYTGFGTHDIVGGARGMIDGFRAIVPGGDVVVSQESATYKPEMHYLARATGGALRIHDAEAAPNLAAYYRFFELFDLPNLPARLLDAASISPPIKAFIEEKMWFALFWLHPLRETWRRELSERHFLELQKHIPMTWLLDPTPLPHHAVLPGLEINDWRELAHFSQKQRDLVLKISGFSDIGWGSRGVHIGSDLAHPEWQAAVERALNDFPHHPWLLQRFHKGRLVEQPYFNAAGAVETMRGRVRLCPYYFILNGRAELQGALATIVPADKKLVHGMKDAILAPTAVAPS